MKLYEASTLVAAIALGVPVATALITGGQNDTINILSERPEGCIEQTAQGFYVRTVFGRENAEFCGFAYTYGKPFTTAVLPEEEEKHK